MNEAKSLTVLSETTTIRELLLAHPRALRILIDRGVPATCASGTIRDAARKSGLPASILLAELQSSIDLEPHEHASGGLSEPSKGLEHQNQAD